MTSVLYLVTIGLGVFLIVESLETLAERDRISRSRFLRPLLIARCVLGMCAIFWGGTTVIMGAILLSSIALIVIVRAPLCGGADAMSFQVQFGLWCASLGGLVGLLGVFWIIAHVTLSYLLAGIAKLRRDNWRQGKALENLLRSTTPYHLPALARRLADSRLLMVVGSWGVILVEILFPLVFILPGEYRLVLLGVMGLFHLMNAYLLGLNRFLIIWCATYPLFLVLP